MVFSIQISQAFCFLIITFNGFSGKEVGNVGSGPSQDTGYSEKSIPMKNRSLRIFSNQGLTLILLANVYLYYCQSKYI